MENHQYLFDFSSKVYIVADTTKKRITYYNKIAKEVYGLHEKIYSLEDIFGEISLEEMILEAVSQAKKDGNSKLFIDLITQRADGDEQLIDLTIGFLDQDRSEIFFEFILKESNTERSLKDMIDHTSKAMFLAGIDEKFTVYYGNELFYNIFGKDKLAFETFFKNSFLAALVDVEKETFQKEIIKYLKTNPDFHSDIQITTVFGVKKWFYFDVQYRKIAKGAVVFKCMLLSIADRVEVRKQLDNISRYFEAIQELTTGALFYINVKTKTATHHSKLLKKAGFPERIDQFPKCALPMLHEDDRQGFEQFIQQSFQGDISSTEVRYKVESDKYSWSRVETLPILGDDDEVLEIVGKICNIDEEKELLERATIDTLTNALNKEYVRESVELILDKTAPNVSHAFLFMDLDNFKYVNDNLGHTFGDFLLSELGKRLRSHVREGDLIGRVGGDEFVFLLKNISKFEILLNKANGLLDTINVPFDDGKITHTIHGSVGIAVYPIHGTTYDELYAHADLALYRSKHRGKNMATVFQPSMESEAK